jgi:CcmD family protein
MKKITNLLLFLFFSLSAYSQESTTVEMADGLFQSGKIYVVVSVLSIIFAGIVIYLIVLDRKISKLEKEEKNKEKK